MKDYIPPLESESIFVGREYELRWLDNRLFDRRHIDSPIFITGLGGVGKTALMKNWLISRLNPLRNEKTRFNFVGGYREGREIIPLWLDCHSDLNKENLIEDLVTQIEKKEERNKVIAIIDSTEDWSLKQYEDAIGKLYNYKSVSNVVFISRKVIEINNSETLEILPLSQSESGEMFNKLLSAMLNEELLLKAIAETKGYPLAISLLTKLLKGNNSTNVFSGLDKPLYELSNNILIPNKEIITSISPIIVSTNQDLVQLLKKRPSDLHRLNSREFEILLAELLRDMGMEVELTKQTKDGGADILAYLNTDVGRLLCLVEAKHYRHDRKIGVDLVRTLYGTLCDAQANSAMLVTSSSFTADAKEFQQKHKYQLNLREYADIVMWIDKFGNKTNNYS